MFVKLLLAAVVIAAASAIPIGTDMTLNSTTDALGIDLSVWQGHVSLATFQCLKKAGFGWAVFQAQEQNGNFNEYCIDDYKRAKQAGFGGVDFYIFPHISADPVAQTKNTVQKLKNAGVLNGNMIWIDVEGKWADSDSNGNVAFIRAMANTIESMHTGCGGHSCVGIYSSKSQWVPITGDDHSFSKYNLWYAHYDNVAHMSDFSPFGGWTKASMKQYKGTTSICGTSVDYNTWAR